VSHRVTNGTHGVPPTFQVMDVDIDLLAGERGPEKNVEWKNGSTCTPPNAPFNGPSSS
jgi:hypothetical protein